MDPITFTGIPTLPRSASTGFKSAGGGSGLTKTESQSLSVGAHGDVPDVAAMDRRRLAAVQRSAQQLANVYVVSDLSFSIFKDSTGQYITRYTSLRDGKVTYIPEPSLLAQTKGAGSDAQFLQIEA